MTKVKTGRSRALFLAIALVCPFVWLTLPNAVASTPDAPLMRGDFAGSVGIGHGRTIYIECRGHGSPTVILEAGLRSRSDFWSERTEDTPPGPTVLAGIARRTRVCAYDRPGTTLGATEFSRSSPVPMPRTAADAIADLRSLLKAAQVPGPYVLVGHSTGGLIARLFASTFPRRVAGMVLVDALSEFLQGPLSPAQVAAYDKLNNGPLEGVNYPDLEQILFRPSFAEMRRAKARHPLKRIRLSVISRKIPLPLPEGLPAGLTTPVVEKAWRKSQKCLARLVPHARHRIAKRSSHYVMFTQPRLIIRQVKYVVRAARKRNNALFSTRE